MYNHLNIYKWKIQVNLMNIDLSSVKNVQWQWPLNKRFSTDLQRYVLAHLNIWKHNIDSYT